MLVEQLRERARGRAAVLAERKRSLERDKGSLLDAGVVANLEGDVARFRVELDEVIETLTHVQPESEQLEADGGRLPSGARAGRTDASSTTNSRAPRRPALRPRYAANCVRSATASSEARANVGGP